LWSDMKNVTQYQIPLTVGRDKYCCPFYALSGLILVGCLSAPSRSGNATGLLFSKLSSHDKDLAGKYLNSAVKEGMQMIAPEIPSEKWQGKCLRRAAVMALLLHQQLQVDLLPGNFFFNY